MTERIQNLYEQLKNKSYRSRRRNLSEANFPKPQTMEEITENLRNFVAMEEPYLLEDDTLGFHRSSWEKGRWSNGNVTPNYSPILTFGFDKIKADVTASMAKTEDAEKRAFGQAMTDNIDCLYEIADRYRTFAEKEGCKPLADALKNLPRKGATSFYEATVMLQICIYFLRLCFHTHITLGRFDQYMYPFYLRDKERGVPDEEIFEILEEFFIALNYDTDLYHGVQQGDNGQSLVLAGFDRDGNYLYNELSEMCMKASLELKLIDPKINLRVGKNTPAEIYEFATELTKAGLGFPQYCNDNVVVPGLVKLGYAYEDALDYTVAACWEFMTPGTGADIPNISSMDFPHVVHDAIVENLLKCDTFEDLLQASEQAIATECDRIIEERHSWKDPFAPFLSLFFDGCIESLTDLFHGGAKYNNYGCHGAGIANATDALTAIKVRVYEEKSVSKEDLLAALEADFEGYTPLRNSLLDAPKMGQNDDIPDQIACRITDAFTHNMNGRSNGRGGIWRAGTGSAMEYLWKGEACPATADGRKSGQPYSCSYAPSLGVPMKGLLSVIQSFTKYDLKNIINGGPVTVEIHDTVLKNQMGIHKTALLVQEFIRLGGHQLQLNSLNPDTLRDAQQHPEDHPNLVVRVWGWSGYFNELDVKYQNHIISRCAFMG